GRDAWWCTREDAAGAPYRVGQTIGMRQSVSELDYARRHTQCHRAYAADVQTRGTGEPDGAESRDESRVRADVGEGAGPAGHLAGSGVRAAHRVWYRRCGDVTEWATRPPGVFARVRVSFRLRHGRARVASLACPVRTRPVVSSHDGSRRLQRRP